MTCKLRAGKGLAAETRQQHCEQAPGGQKQLGVIRAPPSAPRACIEGFSAVQQTQMGGEVLWRGWSWLKRVLEGWECCPGGPAELAPRTEWNPGGGAEDWVGILHVGSVKFLVS